MSCTRAQEFLGQNNISIKTLVDARKESLGKQEALSLAKSVKEIYACKGKKVVHLKLNKNSKAEEPSEEEILALMLGPTGNLRAPTLKINDTLIVGFDQETYTKLLRSPAKTR